MGLDMYLEKLPRIGGYDFDQLVELDYKLDELKKLQAQNPTTTIPIYEPLKPHISRRGSESYGWDSLYEEVGYWRKASAIHAFFVNYVQDGQDDCGTYEVNSIVLNGLHERCKKILAARGDKTIAINELPLVDGFFFGSTEIDGYYYECIKDTIRFIESLTEEDLANNYIVYRSSW